MTKQTRNEGQMYGEFGRTDWKGRGRLEEMVKELQRQKESKLDFTIDMRQLVIEPILDDKGNGSGLRLLPAPHSHACDFIDDSGAFVRKQAVRQLIGRLAPKIPADFFDRLLFERPTRCVDLVNGLLLDTARVVFVRMLDGSVRAVLSNRYRVMDHYDIAFAAMDEAREHDAEILEASLSDSHMRLKIVSKAIWDVIDARRNKGGAWYSGGLGNQKFLNKVAARSEGEMPGGPGTVWPCETISNSETGQGGCDVRYGILAGICFNLATVEQVIAKVHLGETMGEGIWSDETQSLESRAIYGKIVDSVRAGFTRETFARIVAACQSSQEVAVQEPKTAVEQIVKAHNLSDEKVDDILNHFIRDYEMTALGLAQAVARASQDVEDSDEAIVLEGISGAILNNPSVVN